MIAPRRPIAGVLALVLATVGASAAASEPELFGMGARSSAMAGAGAADSSGYEAAYENPAGLAEPTRRRLTLGYVLGRYDLSLDGKSRPIDDTNGVVLGAALPIPFGGALRDRVTIGLAFYFPAGVINRASSPYPDEARLALLDDRTQVVSVIVSGGFRITDRVRVGAGVLALAALTGGIRISPDAGGHISTVSEEQLVVHYAPLVGARVDVTRSLKLGAVLRGESYSDYDIEVTNSLGARLPLTLPTLHIAGVAQYDPLQVALEGAWRPRPWITVAGGATWKHWSAFPLPTEDATKGAPAQPAPGYHDTVVPRVAVELVRDRGAFALRGRAGYWFEWSPSPSSAPTLVDADRHVVTLGGGFQWSGRFTAVAIDLFAQWHELAGSSRASGGFFVGGLTVGVDL